MDMGRRHLLASGAAASIASLLPVRARAVAAELGDNGLYVQDWFVQSFLDLREDLGEAAGNGKNFAVIWEQRGCPYCRELHTVNLARPKIVSYLRGNFDILQLDLWGSRLVTDFDGEELEERALARKWQVNFTPTIVFFPRDLKAMAGKGAREREVARMPGYFKPFHFVSMFEYVRGGHFESQPFQRFLQDKLARFEAEGRKPDVW